MPCASTSRIRSAAREGSCHRHGTFTKRGRQCMQEMLLADWRGSCPSLEPAHATFSTSEAKGMDGDLCRMAELAEAKIVPRHPLTLRARIHGIEGRSS